MKQTMNTVIFDEEVLDRIKRNDDGLEGIDVCFGDSYSFDARTIDWGVEAKHIVSNTHIKALNITLRRLVDIDVVVLTRDINDWENTKALAAKNVMHFLVGVSKIMSIRELSLSGYVVCEEIGLNLLLPLFKRGHLLKLNVQFGPHLTSDDALASAESLALGLEQFSSLEQFTLSSHRTIYDEDAARIVGASRGHHDLKEFTCKRIVTRLRGHWHDEHLRGREWISKLGILTHRPSSKLQTLFISRCEFDDVSMELLCEALLDNKALKKLSFERGEYGSDRSPNGWIAFSKCLPSLSNLTEITIHAHELDGASIGAITRGLSTAPALKALRFETYKGLSLNQTGWQSFSDSLRDATFRLEALDIVSNDHSNEQSNEGSHVLIESLSVPSCSTLKKLSLSGSSLIDDRGVIALGQVLFSHSQLREIELSNNRHVTAGGWCASFCEMMGFDAPLQRVVLDNCRINDMGISLLVNALTGVKTLEHLSLDQCDNTHYGLRFLSALVKCNNPALTVICCYGSLMNPDENINDAVLMNFARALEHNTNLQRLETSLCDDQIVTKRGWDAVEGVLCNQSSIEAICSSNHTLQHMFSEPTDLPDQIASYLKLNENKNKAEVVRHKLIQYYFIDGSQKLNIFINMRKELKLHAMGWMCRNNDGLSIMYQFAKSAAFLFEIDSTNIGSGEASGKRKRDT